MTMTAKPTMMYKYEFKDMKVIALEDGFGAMGKTNIYVEIDEDLIFVFGVKTESFRDVDINSLHENGYFDDFAYSDKAARFMKGEKIDE